MELFIEGLWPHAKKETTLILVNFENNIFYPGFIENLVENYIDRNNFSIQISQIIFGI